MTTRLSRPGLAIEIVLSPGDDFTRPAAAWAIASVIAGAFAYAAAFGALSLRVKRPVVIGLVYVLFWEGSIATFAPSARWLSLGAYARAVVAGACPPPPTSTCRRSARLAAVAVLAGLAAVATWWCGRRLTRLELP